MLSTKDLTTGERLRVARRRQGVTQVQAAKQHGISIARYKAAEKDEERPVKSPGIGKLLPHEACFIMRRRAEMTLDDLSEETGLSKWWLCLMERGNAPVATLVEYWA